MAYRRSFTTAVSTAVLASLLAGCAAGSRVQTASSFGGPSNGEIGLATKAMLALNSNDLASATSLAERAVEKTPGDAGFRSLLGNIYFASGRFASAESAYQDALSLYDNQPQTVLKLVLAEIAQGKQDQAVEHLRAGQALLDPADVGLALALAGHVSEGLDQLQVVARAQNADARVRQNLALVSALAGDWTQARVIASQDLSSDQVEQRMHQWAKMAQPTRASDQIASLLGITPASSDAGQPVRLALRQDNSDNRALASAAPVQPSVTVALPAARLAAPAPAPQATPLALAPVADLAAASIPPAPPPADPVRLAADPLPAPAPVIAAAEHPAPAFTEADYVEPAKFAAAIAKAKARRLKAMMAKAAAPAAKRPAMVPAALRQGRANAVVQLGAYSNAASVQLAWDKAARKYAALRGFAPVSARVSTAKGNFYRLSVHGFGSAAQASGLCQSIRRSGGSCFVRSLAGDAPMQIAMR